MQDAKRGRYAILICGICTMLMFGTIYSWSVFIPPLESEFAWQRSQTSLVFSIAMVGLSLGMLSVGFFSKRFSLKTCSIVATSCIAIGLFLCQFVTELWQLYLFYGVLCGFGSGMSYTTWTTNVLAWFGDKVGFASGLLVMGFGMGALLLGTLASWLIYSPLGWRWAFVIIGVLTLVEGVIALRFIKEPPAEVAAMKPKRDAAGVDLPCSIAIRQPSFWLFCIWRSVVMGACGAVFAEALVMMTSIGSTVAFATAAVGALGLGNGLGRPIGGLLYDRIGQNKTLVVLPVLALAISVAMAIAYWFDAPSVFAPFLLADGLLYGMYSAINTSYMRITFGQRNLASNTGASAVVLAPFNIVFPLLAALVFEQTSSYELFFVGIPVMACISLACGILCSFANRNLVRKYGTASEASGN